jgi:methylmalonyl-CoA epimerase
MTKSDKKQASLQFHHIGVVVKDLDKAIEYLTSLGIGPFESPEPPSSGTEMQVLGKPIDCELKGSMAKVGQLKIELLQPVGGESHFSEFLSKRGDGVHHIGFVVDDIEEEIAKFNSKGVKILTGGKWSGGGFVHLETDEVGGIIIELMQ